ncbi:MAG: zf-HC2 domain-containing protein [Planctomycetes bacterium]|nr:zf-HC2 domain-containing protein [Planctomycetota bacterium]
MTPFCPDDERFARWLEGTLDPSETAAVSNHLATCDDCRRSTALARIAMEESAPALGPGQEQLLRAATTGGCPDEHHLACWVDGTLDAHARAVTNNHLAACDRCRRAVALADLSLHEPPADVASRVRRAARGVVVVSTECPSEERLTRFVCGPLDPAERSTVVAHLASCDRCRRAAAMVSLTRTEPVHGLTPAQERAALDAVLGRRRRPIGRAVATAAALLVTITASYFGLRATPPAEETASPPQPDELKVMHVRPSESSASFLTDTQVPRLLSTPNGAAFNVEGHALLMLDRRTEASVAATASGFAFVLEINRGRAFINTVGNPQTWDIRHGERRLSIPVAQGRFAVEVEAGSLSLIVLSGEATVLDEKLTQGCGASLSAEGLLSRPKADSSTRRAATARASELQPKEMVVFRAGFAEAVDDGGPAVSPPLEGRRWIGLSLNPPIPCVGGMSVHVRYKTAATNVTLVAGGQAREIPVNGSDTWLEEDWPLEAASGELRSLFLGVRRETPLHVGGLEVRRPVE